MYKLTIGFHMYVGYMSFEKPHYTVIEGSEVRLRLNFTLYVDNLISINLTVKNNFCANGELHLYIATYIYYKC